MNLVEEIKETKGFTLRSDPKFENNTATFDIFTTHGVSFKVAFALMSEIKSMKLKVVKLEKNVITLSVKK